MNNPDLEKVKAEKLPDVVSSLIIVPVSVFTKKNRLHDMIQRSLHQSKYSCKPDTECVVGDREKSVRRQDNEEQETEVETEASP